MLFAPSWRSSSRNDKPASANGTPSVSTRLYCLSCVAYLSLPPHQLLLLPLSFGIVGAFFEAFLTQASPHAFTMRSVCGFLVMYARGISRMIALMLRPACASLPL